MAFVVNRIDHVVLNCRDVDTTTDWYVRVLGMEREVFGEGRVALRFGNQKINVRPTGAPNWGDGRGRCAGLTRPVLHRGDEPGRRRCAPEVARSDHHRGPRSQDRCPRPADIAL